jgi:hypothetical protein
MEKWCTIMLRFMDVGPGWPMLVYVDESWHDREGKHSAHYSTQPLKTALL